MICAAGPPGGPSRSRWPNKRFPAGKKMTLIIIGSLAVAAIAIGAIIAATFQQVQHTIISDSAPEVNFVKFGVERQELWVGQNTSILFNVENLEDSVIEDARVVVAIEPEVGNTYLSTSNSTIELPTLYTNARSGDMTVTITATGTPAMEAVYDVACTLFAQGTRTEIRQFELTIRQ